MQRMQFRAKSAKNDIKPMDFLKCNFYFETEGVPNYCKVFQRNRRLPGLPDQYIVVVF
jgi:hypothetical protein